MMLELHRDTRFTDCTLGVLEVNGHKLHTLEPPWLPTSGSNGGKPFVSCVPPGTYRLDPHVRPCGERTFILSNPELDVYQLPHEAPRVKREAVRSLVTIRAANHVYDVIDAIGLGMGRAKTNVGWKMERSKEAMNVLRTVVGTQLDVRLRID